MQTLSWLWSLPGTFIGWLLASCLNRRLCAFPGPRTGMLCIPVPHLFPSWAAAQTWGRIILRVDRYWTARMWVHELEHVHQWGVLGPLMFLAYPIASLIALLRGRHYYHDNFFEVQATAAEDEWSGGVTKYLEESWFVDDAG